MATAKRAKFFYFLFEQPSFFRMVWPKEYAPTHLSLEEVAVRDCQKVLTGSLRQYFVDFW
jgi:hypothetical protein